MPTYGKNNFKESNVNYLNKDFASLKTSLMNYAKSYFPDTYRDFNETSPGMMLLEMNAYVGDVLSYYIDNQFKEMLLPLAEERRNIVTMAKMFGYKVKPIVASYADLTFTSNVNAMSNNSAKIDYSNGGIFDTGIQVTSATNGDTIFTTLEPVDFQISQSTDLDVIGTTDDAGLAQSYTLSRVVRAVSATEKTAVFKISAPEKFKTITIPDTNVVDIISCVDSNGSNWYEVDYLAQDKVPITTHYTDDVNRDSAYVDTSGLATSTAVPFSLSYIKTTKRFTRETNLDNTTSLVFGNGVLRNEIDGTIDQGYIDMEQVGIVMPGKTNDLNSSINPLLGDEYSTLGETPNQTTLTVTYRVGGGISANVPSSDLTTIPVTTAQNGNTSATIVGVTNNRPARGGKNEEDTIEIKEKAKAFFSTQNRCVTKEDYEARILNIPSRFGNIAKVYVTTGKLSEYTDAITAGLQNILTNLETEIDSYNTTLNDGDTINSDTLVNLPIIASGLSDVINTSMGTMSELGTIDAYLLGYNNSKQLVGNPHFDDNKMPITLLSNISNYLSNFKLMTDVVTLNDGYIINFGVFFDIIAEKYANKQEVKLKCIDKIKEYFRIERMQFNQPIYKSQLEFELMGVEGVRSIGHVTITQDYDYFYGINGSEAQNITGTENQGLYNYIYSVGSENSFEVADNGISGYGYKYDFKNALSDDSTIIVPPLPSTPSVFELKNPNQNIQGRVR